MIVEIDIDDFTQLIPPSVEIERPKTKDMIALEEIIKRKNIKRDKDKAIK